MGHGTDEHGRTDYAFQIERFQTQRLSLTPALSQGEGESSADGWLRRAIALVHGPNACEKIERGLSMNLVVHDRSPI